MTTYRLMPWMHSGSNVLSETKVVHLIRDIMMAEDFDCKHLENFSVKWSLQKLDRDKSRKGVIFPDDWIQTSVGINIPTRAREDGPQPYMVPGFYYRPLIEVIYAAFSNIYNELYTSYAWLEAQDSVQRLPKEPGCLLECVIVGLMFFSDATHLANFRTVKAWPLYMYFGNLTKYARSAPKSGACHLVEFLPSVPDSIKDIISNLPHISKTGMRSLLTHCRRELVFPRIFTYSADYPEKVLIVTMKDMGLCPCPHCVTPKSMFGFLGLARDMNNCINNLQAYMTANIVKARDFIYTWGNTVDDVKVENMLGEGSQVPVLNQFVTKLGPFGLDTFHMLVIDFMHECELEQCHMLKVVNSQICCRFQQVPTFGNSMIHKFSNNTSEMKRLAAHDFEDILQCAIPVFKGLFPTDHDWHALAKLQIHLESTVEFVKEMFKKVSQNLCKMAQQSETNGTFPGSNRAKTKRFNLGTYKFHAMGDYARTIRFFSTTDSFSTQIVRELAHRALKVFYPLTSKKNTPDQLAKHECRCHVLRRVAEVASSSSQPGANAPPLTLSEMHHSIAATQNNPLNFCQNFCTRLKDHILYRLKGLDISLCDHMFTDKECNFIIIPNNTIYSVQTMQMHYTTYNFSPRTHSNVMVLSGETEPTHPYWYACVLGIYHIEVLFNQGGQLMKRHIKFLWVRWLAVVQGHKLGIKYACLPKIVFVEELDLDAFGFLEPGQFYVGIFIDQDMFMHCTNLDCLGSQAALAAQANGTGDVITTNEDVDYEETGDGKNGEGCDDGQEDSDVEDSDLEELNELSNGELDDDNDDHISF
ncbi:hypothetical protein BDR06DRAFT_982465 [Suillus hirtellus]|nr:hypothetical protein BDR06DRAFT_982465 [Suillus hirtellus]